MSSPPSAKEAVSALGLQMNARPFGGAGRTQVPCQSHIIFAWMARALCLPLWQLLGTGHASLHGLLPPTVLLFPSSQVSVSGTILDHEIRLRTAMMCLLRNEDITRKCSNHCFPAQITVPSRCPQSLVEASRSLSL